MITLARRHPVALAIALCAVLLVPATAAAAVPADHCPGKVYGKGRRQICLPLGARSFADSVVGFTAGAKPSKAPFDDPARALGEPDYVSTGRPDFLSIGCDGVAVLRFDDNVLVDVEGPDLYVFEVGPYVEDTDLAISADGVDWRPVGRIAGARADVDIAAVAAADERFRYVRLTNAGTTGCGGRHSGADIDAVAAVGAEWRLALDASVLFDVGQSVLKPAAEAALDAAATEIAALGADARITIEGHTDASGDPAANLALSEARAESVRAGLAARLRLPPTRIRVRGYGEARPVADNTTDAGRARNRRVELLVSPN